MATKRVNTGRRFGDEKPVQRNKENMPDQKPNRSPGESNANRYMPSVKEDTDVMFPKDVERVKKSMSPTGKGAARQSQVDAGKRAGGRMLGRAGYAGLAFEAGRTAGDAIADKAIEKMSEGKVKLSDYAKQRMREEEDFQAMQKALREADDERDKEKGMYRGGAVKRMAAGGSVDKNKRSYDGGIYTAEMGAPPFDIDMGSSPKPTKKEMQAPKPAPKQKLKEAPRDLMPEDFEKMKKEKDKKKMAMGGSVMSPKQQDKVGKVMKEYKAGSLHSGAGGKVVKSPKQAVAIALSEARRMKKK